MAGKTLAQQEAIVQGMVTKLAAEHPKKALELIESYETGVIALGNGVVRDEFADSLENAFANEEKRVDLIAQGVETKRKDSVDAAYRSLTNAFTYDNIDVPDSVDIEMNEGVTVTVDTSQVTNELEMAEAISEAVFAIDDKTLSQNVKNEVVGYFRNGVEEAKGKVFTRQEKAGVFVAHSQFMELLDTKDSEGNYIYGDAMMTSKGRANLAQEWTEELLPVINDIHANPELDLSEKLLQAKMATNKFLAEKRDTHDTFVKEKEDAIKSVKAEERTGGDQERFYVADVFTQVAKTEGDLAAMERRPEIVAKAREFNAETERQRDEILNRSMTDEEIASGMTTAEFTLKKDEEMRTLNVDRRALYQQDYGVDEEIDGKTTEAQQTDNALKKQEAIPKELKNVEIGDSTSGFASSKAGGLKAQDPTWVKGNKAKNLVEDINAKQGIGTEFKIGLFDNLRLDWITRNLPQEIDTIHKANQVRAIKFQQQGEEYMKADKGQGLVAEFITGETMTRVIREGDAGMTLDELSKGDIRGVKFDPTTLNQSATPIVPFDLVNKALTNQDMSPTEEAALRDYADLLYDSSELDEAGKTAVLQKMVELQVNAYAQIGFRFAK
jgi:hypothetical protein